MGLFGISLFRFVLLKAALSNHSSKYQKTGSYADDNGVWIICKSLLWSSPEFTKYLLAKCEKRLRREIGDRHYSLATPDTVCHQLFGFMEALTLIGLLDRDKLFVLHSSSSFSPLSPVSCPRRKPTGSPMSWQ